jgi:hypothetical protein
MACKRAAAGADGSSGFECLVDTFSGSFVALERSNALADRLTFKYGGPERFEIGALRLE